MLTEHFRKFLELLEQFEVEYLIVGGYAVALHGYVRATGDLDIWINQTPENADKMLSVMLHFGFSAYDFKLEDFLPDEAGKPSFVFIGEEPIKSKLILLETLRKCPLRNVMHSVSGFYLMN